MTDNKRTSRDLIIHTIRGKSVLKQEIYHLTKKLFLDLKEVIERTAAELRDTVAVKNKHVKIGYSDKGEFEAELRIAGDLLIFYMHSNVFSFDKSHNVWKNSYVKEDPRRAYCCIINVYNFLNDSFKYNRVNDLGYLIARIFVNKDKHFFVEGKRQLGFLYQDFVNAVLTKSEMVSICESAILYTLDFDLLTPPYDNVKEVNLQEMLETSQMTRLKTGKRLGFRFSADDDSI